MAIATSETTIGTPAARKRPEGEQEHAEREQDADALAGDRPWAG